MKDFLRQRVVFYTAALRGRYLAREIMEDAARFGAAGVELMNWAPDLRIPDRKVAAELGAFAREKGLALPCFSCSCNFAEDPMGKLENLKAYAELCAGLEIPYLHHTVLSPLKREDLPPDEAQLMRVAAECALELQEYAAARGVKTIVEDQGLIVNGAEGYRLFAQMTQGKIGVLLDVGNILFVDEYAEDFYEAFKEKVVHVHIKDYLRDTAPIGEKCFRTAGGLYLADCALGEGIIAHDKIAAALKRERYRGYYSLELRPAETDEELWQRLQKAAELYA